LRTLAFFFAKKKAPKKKHQTKKHQTKKHQTKMHAFSKRNQKASMTVRERGFAIPYKVQILGGHGGHGGHQKRNLKGGALVSFIQNFCSNGAQSNNASAIQALSTGFKTSHLTHAQTLTIKSKKRFFEHS
jgi:hypothetical protein